MDLALPLNPNLKDLPVYQPGRPIAEVARELGMDPEDIIKLASNENSLGPSPSALAAMEKTLRNLHLYPDGNVFYLKKQLAERLGLEPAQIIFGNGSNEIIEFVGHTLMGPDTEVVVSEFCFAIYPIMARMFGSTISSIPARDYGHDLPAMRRAITSKTRVVFVANPNNPTGTLASREDVLDLVEAVPPEVLLVMDEAYFEFLNNPVDLLPYLREGAKSNLLVMRTFSKIYGLAGLRLGYGLGHPELISAMEKVRQPFNINALVQAGALAALGDDEHLQRTRKNNAEGLAFFEKACRERSWDYVPSSANFILIKVGDGQNVFEELQRRGVIVRAMGGYGLGEWIRVTMGTPGENARCLEAMKELEITQT